MTGELTTVIGDAFLGNSIFANTRSGIFLGGGNNQQEAPVINRVWKNSIGGTLSSHATSFRIEFFANMECDPSGFGRRERHS